LTRAFGKGRARATPVNFATISRPVFPGQIVRASEVRRTLRCITLSREESGEVERSRDRSTLRRLKLLAARDIANPRSRRGPLSRAKRVYLMPFLFLTAVLAVVPRCLRSAAAAQQEERTDERRRGTSRPCTRALSKMDAECKTQFRISREDADYLGIKFS